RERDMRSRIRSALPGHVGHAGHMDEDVVGSELTALGERVESGTHAEGLNDVQGNREAKLATDLPGLLVAGDVDLAAHHHRKQLVLGREVLLLQPPGVAGIFQLVAPALEIAEDRTAARILERLDGGIRVLRRMVYL